MSAFEALAKRLAGERGVDLRDLAKGVWQTPGMQTGVGVVRRDQQPSSEPCFNFVLLGMLNNHLELGELECFVAVRVIGAALADSRAVMVDLPPGLPASIRASIARVLLKHDLHMGYRLAMAGEEVWPVTKELTLLPIEAEYLAAMYRATKVGMVLPPGKQTKNPHAPGQTPPAPGESAPGAAAAREQMCACGKTRAACVAEDH